MTHIIVWAITFNTQAQNFGAFELLLKKLWFCFVMFLMFLNLAYCKTKSPTIIGSQCSIDDLTNSTLYKSLAMILSLLKNWSLTAFLVFYSSPRSFVILFLICPAFDSHRNCFLAVSFFRLPHQIIEFHHGLAQLQQQTKRNCWTLNAVYCIKRFFLYFVVQDPSKSWKVMLYFPMVKLKLDVNNRCSCFNKSFSSAYVFMFSPISFFKPSKFLNIGNWKFCFQFNWNTHIALHADEYCFVSNVLQ